VEVIILSHLHSVLFSSENSQGDMNPYGQPEGSYMHPMGMQGQEMQHGYMGAPPMPHVPQEMQQGAMPEEELEVRGGR
jgi:hypothetical protein